MNKQTAVEAILDASDELYSTGRTAEAGILTNVAKRIAQIPQGDWNPDDMAADDGFLGSDQYDTEQEGLGRQHDHLGGRLNDLSGKLGPTTQELEEYYSLLKANEDSGDGGDGGDGFGMEESVPHPKHRSSEDFARMLGDAGAEVGGLFGN